MSYLSQISYTGDGTVGPYAVPFPYIEKAHVKVYINNTATTDFTWPTTSSIQFNLPITTGATILIKRETPRDQRIVEFQNSALTSSNNFNVEGNQDFYLAQEFLDGTDYDQMKVNNTSNWEARDKTIQNLAEPVYPTDAATLNTVTTGGAANVQAQVDIATESAIVATTQAGIATTQAGIATDKADQFTAILEPDGTTVKEATHSDSATLADTATTVALSEATKGDTRFQVSGCVFSDLTIAATTATTIQDIALNVPDGKTLVLKRARFIMKDDNRFKFRVYGYSTSWTSTSNQGDVTPDFALISPPTDGFLSFSIQIYNSHTAQLTLPKGSGWWIDLVLE
jgi:hypothetical protein